MIKIYQTRFGGIDKPLEEQGNCFQACLASILEIPLEEAFDCILYDRSPRGTELPKQPWYLAFNKWLAKFNLTSIYLSWQPTMPTVTTILGYHIAEVKSPTLENGETHAVVIHDGDLVHNPNPGSQANPEDLLGIYLIVPLDATRGYCQEVVEVSK